VQKENTKRPAPSSPLELYYRTVEGNFDPFPPNAVASFRARLRNLVDAGKVAHPGAWVAAALDCPQIPDVFRDELRRQVAEARAGGRVDPVQAPPARRPRARRAGARVPDDMPDLDALAAVAPPRPEPTAAEAADLADLLAAVRAEWAAAEAPDRFPAPVGGALPWERIVQGAQDRPSLTVAELSASAGVAGLADRRVA
jgi:hypothetical protein